MVVNRINADHIRLFAFYSKARKLRSLVFVHLLLPTHLKERIESLTYDDILKSIDEEGFALLP